VTAFLIIRASVVSELKEIEISTFRIAILDDILEDLLKINSNTIYVIIKIIKIWHTRILFTDPERWRSNTILGDNAVGSVYIAVYCNIARKVNLCQEYEKFGSLACTPRACIYFRYLNVLGFPSLCVDLFSGVYYSPKPRERYPVQFIRKYLFVSRYKWYPR